jgi:hypothetical protein
MEQNRLNPNNMKARKDSPDVENRAEMDGKTGKFETEELKKTDTSAMPGAENEGDIGTAASGAGLGGNKGTGTNNKSDFT